MQIIENDEKKYIISENYNCILDKKTNSFLRCGKNVEDVPLSGSLEYVDMEISTIYNNTDKYDFMFKKEVDNPNYMNFDTFRKIIDFLPKSLNHINFITDPECKTNPDLWSILFYCKLKKISTSISVSNIESEVTASFLPFLCKSISVDLHLDKSICYNTIKILNKNNIKPNLNILVSKESHHLVINTIHDYYNEKLTGINSIYLIGLKNIENWRFLNKLKKIEIKNILNDMLDKKIPFNIDPYLSSYFIKNNKNKLKYYHDMTLTPCESLGFYAYIDIKNYIFPCKYYIPLPQNFIGFNLFDNEFDNIWFKKFSNIRKKFIEFNKKGIRFCPLFEPLA